MAIAMTSVQGRAAAPIHTIPDRPASRRARMSPSAKINSSPVTTPVSMTSTMPSASLADRSPAPRWMMIVITAATRNATAARPAPITPSPSGSPPGVRPSPSGPGIGPGIGPGGGPYPGGAYG
jgi:hypothetical protein